MIALQRRSATIPAKFVGAGLAQSMKVLLTSFYDNAGEVPFNAQKGLQIWGGAKANLKKESFNKCAYCEAPTAVVAHGDVEHFRPKSSYWWLAYAYDNYTYACQICNQVFKGDLFDVKGPLLKPPKKLPATRPAEAKLLALAGQLCPNPGVSVKAELRTLWGKEKAELLHPYLDEPEALLAWQVDTINQEVTLVALPGNAASALAVQACERLLGLNREELRRLRYPQYDRIEGFALVIQESPHEDIRQRARSRLIAAARDDQPFAGMTRFFLRQWGLLAPL